MRILSLDTSNAVASVSIIEDAKVLGEKFSEDQKTHSEKILPLVDALLSELSLKVSDIDMFCVCTGPGSFTGIRIGVATVKGIAQALNKKVFGVTALEGLIEAQNADNVCAIIDAKHDNVYVQCKTKNNYGEPDFKNIDELIEELRKTNENYVFVGSGALVHKEKLNGFEVNENIVIEKSSDLALFAIKQNFEPKNAEDIIPVYLRKAQAER